MSVLPTVLVQGTDMLSISQDDMRGPEGPSEVNHITSCSKSLSHLKQCTTPPVLFGVYSVLALLNVLLSTTNSTRSLHSALTTTPKAKISKYK